MSLIIPSPPSAPIPSVNYSGVPTTTWGTTVTSGGSAHTEGTVTEVVAATTQDIDTLDIIVYGTAAATVDTPALWQIYTGASFGQVLIPHLMGGYAANTYANTQGTPAHYCFPVFIPRGTRIGASFRSVSSSDTAQIMVRGRWTGWKTYRRIEALGATTAASEGTNVTPGTTSDGTFTSIGTTGFAYSAVMGYVWQENTGTVTPNSLTVLDIGTGSALIAQLENVMGGTVNTNECDNYVLPAIPIPCHVASGTALQARLQNSASNTLTRSVIIYGLA